MNLPTSFACVILLFTLIAADAQSFFDNPIFDDPIHQLECGLVNCGQGGKCTAAPNTSVIPVQCECDTGWVEPVFANITIPTCIPNCTTDFSCGGTAPAPPLPPLILNLTDPCFLTFCIQGTCVPQEKGHICQCNPGANNLFNKPEMPCFNNCVLDADCDGMGFGNQPPPPPSASTRHGKSHSPSPDSSPNGVPSSGIQHSTTLLLLVAVLLSMF
ncbi:hypothetical protein ACHQM5_002391 [Ranunculus cassubicifolius]